MKKNQITFGMLFLCLGLMFFGSMVFADAPTSSQAKPNIILVLIDDMGWSDLSCFGNQVVKTPNIDRLASEGLSLTQFYVSAPICSPSRCALTTGQYPQRWQITSFLAERQMNIDRDMSQWLDPVAPTLARTLQQAGYATGHFGKWHLGGQRDVGEAPLINEYGFDESLTNFEGIGPRVLPLLNAFDGTEPKKYSLGSDQLGRGEIRWADRNRVTTCYVEKAVDFIKKSQNDGKPFYINLWPDDVHSPFFPAKELRGNESKKDRYHGVLVELDRQFGPLFELVRSDEKLRNNTLIVLLSDNGPEPGAGSAKPLRGQKGMLYEGGIRSPLIVWGPKFLDLNCIGSKNDVAVMQSIDLVPSLLKIAGVAVPDSVVLDGENFADVLCGKKTQQERVSPLFWRRPPDRPGPKGEPLPDLAMRSGNWKFLMQFDGSNPQLYDLNSDFSEQKNLAEQHSDLVETFRQKVTDWNASVSNLKNTKHITPPK